MNTFSKSMSCLLVLSTSALPLQSDGIVGNLDGYTNDSGTVTSLNVGGSANGKEFGFTTGPNYYALSDAEIRVKIYGSGYVPTLALYQGGTVGSTATPPTGSPLAIFTSPSFTIGTLGTATFTLPNYLLAPNTTYWIATVGTGTATTNINWTSGSPQVSFTGNDLLNSTAFAALFGTSTDPTTWTSTSSVLNWFQAHGTVQNPINLTTSWLGNSSAYLACTQDIDDICVNGTDIYTNTRWDEQGCEIQRFSTTNGAILDTTQNHWYTHNDAQGNMGGIAITANQKYVFAGEGLQGETSGNSIPTGYAAAVIARYNHSGTPMPWTNTQTTTLPYGIDWKNGPGNYLLELRQVSVQDPLDPSGPPLGNLAERSGGPGDEIVGLAATDSGGSPSTDGLLYVCDLGGQFNGTISPKIEVYDATTMQPFNISTGTNSWAVTRPGKICIDGSPTPSLWMIQPPVYGSNGAITTPADVVQFNLSTGAVTGTITFAGNANPVLPGAIAWNPTTSQLMIADDGLDQNIKFYNIGNLTSPADTMGALNGVYSAPFGSVGPLRFNCPTGLGVDSSGKVIVSQNGQGPSMDRVYNKPGTTEYVNDDIAPFGILQSYTWTFSGVTWTGTLNWADQGLLFCDVADVDPASDTDVYTGDKHFTIDYTQPAGSQWTFHDYTADPIDFPQDIRFNNNSVYAHDTALIRDYSPSPGQTFRYMFMTDQTDKYVAIYSFVGQTAVPCGLYAFGNSTSSPDPSWPNGHPTTTNNEWIWTYNPDNQNIHPDGQPIIPDSSEYAQNNSGSLYAAGAIRCVDSKLNLWTGKDVGSTGWQFRKITPTFSTDSPPIPQYNFNNATFYSSPVAGSNVGHLDRMQYDASTDTMYLCGWATTETYVSGYWSHIWKISNFTTAPSQAWVTAGTFTYNPEQKGVFGTGTQTESFAVAGNYVFLLYDAPQPYIEVYKTSDGSYYDTIFPGKNVNYLTAQPDDGQALHVHELSDGQYVIYTEDNAFARNLMYVWTPGLSSLANGTYTMIDSYTGGIHSNWVEQVESNYSVAPEVVSSPVISSQKWTVTNNPDGTCSIVNLSTNAALELASDGKSIIAQNALAVGNLKQEWQIQTAASGTKSYFLINRSTAQSLTKAALSGNGGALHTPGISTLALAITQHAGELWTFTPSN